MRDLSQLLNEWPFEPDGVTARVILGEDGQEKIQLRLDLGVLQMELDGRPDGARVHHLASWLEYFEQEQQAHDAAHPDGAPFQLSSADCQELLREGVQYYHRYLSFWHLKRYELCARDTSRNLRLFAFVRKHAAHDHDKLQFDQWRPYVTMMHTRAVAMPLVELRLIDAAIPAIDAGIAGIEQFLEDYGQENQIDNIRELVFLKRWRKELLEQNSPEDGEDSEKEDAPVDPVTVLNSALQAAIEDERYEEAARLRDELRRQQGLPPSSSPDAL